MVAQWLALPPWSRKMTESEISTPILCVVVIEANRINDLNFNLPGNSLNYQLEQQASVSPSSYDS